MGDQQTYSRRTAEHGSCHEGTGAGDRAPEDGAAADQQKEKQKESIPELTPGALDEFVQADRVAQWMRGCVGALKEFLEHTGLPLQRPLDHEGANEQPPPPPP